MRKLSMKELKRRKAGEAHYHWVCFDFGIGKKRFVSKPYYFNGLMLSGRDIENHNKQYGHEKYTKLFICYKKCK